MSTTSNSPSKPSRKMLGYLRYLAEQTGTSFTYPHTAAEAHREIERLRSLKRESKAEIKRERRAVQDDMATRRGDAAAVRSDELVGYGSSAAWAKDPEREPTEEQIDYPKARPARGPRVVHCKREHFDVYVGRGRGSIWGNPFREGRDGTREQVIAKYERWLLDQPHRMAALSQLRGKTLGCWCAPKPCHADVLLRLANACPSTAIEDGRKGKPHALAGYAIGGEHRLIVVQRIDGLIRVGDIPADGKGKRYLIADHLKTNGELDALIADYNQQVASRGAIPADTVAIDALMELAL